MGKTRGTLDLAPECVEVCSHPMTLRVDLYTTSVLHTQTHINTRIPGIYCTVLLIAVYLYVCSQNEEAVTEAVLRSSLGSRWIQSHAHVRKVILVSPNEDKRLVNFVLDSKKKRK